MFSITREDFFGEETIKLSDPITGAYTSIIPSFGGNLNELVLEETGRLHSIISGDASLDSLKGEQVNFYRGAKLSPFPNRVADGQYNFRDQIYTLNKNNGAYALHGLIWNCPFRIVREEVTADFAVIELTYDYISNYTGYPFNYSICIVYRLECFQLICFTTLQNKGNETIPIGDGWHPYFHVNNMDLMKLKLPACRQLEMDGCIPTGSYVESDLSNKEVSLKDQELDHCFELIVENGITETHLIDQDHKREIVLWQECSENKYSFLQIYIPPDRKSVAIEPMTCAPDAFNNKMGLIELEPDERIKISFGIQLKPL
ncbi:aldose 1-epimerase [Cytophaga aurantiaca]|uniref:aldose 1-epimerase n=1 Tax=Cytophaga aurantiaca TaxID=29530 RepID=UPI00037D9B3F|nr:aldose 1-epimerase [Cytophaga aurantiaca]